MLRRLKLTLLAASERTGLSSLVASSRWRRNRLLILGYHGVALRDEASWNGELFLTEATLRRRFELLRETGANVLSLEDALRRLHVGSLPPRSVVLTFDDGFADFSRLAYPLLQEFGFHATLYLTTHYVEQHYPVFTVMLRYLLWAGRSRQLSLSGISAGEDIAVLSTSQGFRLADESIRAYADAERLNSPAKDALLVEVAQRLGIDFEELRASRVLSLLTPGEVASLDPAVVSVHLHTHRHRVPVDRELFIAECEDNAAAIARLTPRWAGSRHFCYPSGVTNPRFLPWLRDLGIESATTCISGLASRSTEPLMLPRLLDTMQLTDTEFVAWLMGVGAILPSRALSR
jgi:peptidoglycan/xylan/chitin deacetylase (PgdA/CDA1 family)